MNTYHGMPVPYVALWSDEAVGPTMESTPQGVQPVPGAKWVRREFDMWMMAGPTRQTGVPDFGSTQSARQRKCMTRPLCQVCGESRTDMFWVIPNDGSHPALWDSPEGHFVINPPVCDDCLEVAGRWCPHLRAKNPYHVEVLKRGKYRPIGVSGDLVIEGQTISSALILLDSPLKKSMLGRELVVLVDD